MNRLKRLSPGLGQKKISSDLKSRQGARQKYLSNQKGKIHWQQRRSLPLNLSRPEGVVLQVSRAPTSSTPQERAVDSLFKLLNKSNRLKLPEARCPEEVGKTNNPNYCLYHRMLGQPTKNYYAFKDILQALIDAKVLKLHPKQKKVMINMTSFFQFGNQPPTPARVVPIPKGELRMVNTDPHHQ